MEIESILGPLVLVGTFSWIGWLFYKDARIEKYGIVLNDKIISMRETSSNDGGSSNVRYSLWVDFPDGQRLVEGKDTVSTFYGSQLEPGKEIKIKYLNDNNIAFIFNK